MKEKLKYAHMLAAYAYAACSTATRRKVGCLIVKNDNPIAEGYNGMPPGDTNECEIREYNHRSIVNSNKYPFYDAEKDAFYRTITKPEVIHAEDNALLKLSGCHESARGASVFVTTAPCRQCAARLLRAGVAAVYYDDIYSCTSGIELLLANGVHVEQIQIDKHIISSIIDLRKS